jgi:lysophospholipase L1-like esterase
MKCEPSVSLPIATVASVASFVRRPLPLGRSLLGRSLVCQSLLGRALLLVCLAACGSDEPAVDGSSNEGSAPGEAPPANPAAAPATPSNPAPSSPATNTPAPSSPAPSSPATSEGPSPSAPSAPPSEPTPSEPAPSEVTTPGAIDIDMNAGSAAGSASGGGDASPQTCNSAGAASAATPGVWVVGDSTASLYDSTLYPRMGWAQPLQEYYAPACATVNDRALSGRSSKSFIDEGAWAPVRDALRAGDFVLIQFSHNDEKAEDPLRFTDPATTFPEYLSIYIDDTLAHGATPVLLTPIQRNNWTGTSLRDTHGAYPDAIRQLAEARSVALVDATALTTEFFERIGTAAATELFLNLSAGQFPNYPTGNADNTHLREEGAHAVARLILADLARQGSPLGRLVLNVPVAP